MLAGAPAARAQPTTPGPPAVLDGPNASIVSLGGVAVARDGTGGVAYLKQVGGIAHVFVSALTGGTFASPTEFDAGLPDASSQPVIAAGNAGLLVVAFVNDGNLYAVTRGSAAGAFGAPSCSPRAPRIPAISATQFGKVYIAFTAAGSGGHDVRTAYYNQGVWAVEPTPLDAVAGDDAGVGSGRPSVVAAGDGLGVVSLGRGGPHLRSPGLGGEPERGVRPARPADVREPARADRRRAEDLRRRAIRRTWTSPITRPSRTPRAPSSRACSCPG